ncbi:hypothetical protein ACLB2K_070251 [Fragaria x ananassa]
MNVWPREIWIVNCDKLEVAQLARDMMHTSNLEKLTIDYFEGLTTTTSFPTNLTSLSIDKIKNCKALMESQGLQRLASLRELSLRGKDDGGLVSFPPAAENSKETEILLPRSLVHLTIARFPNLKKLSKGFQFLTSLESIWIWNCPKLTTLPVEEGLPLSLGGRDVYVMVSFLMGTLEVYLLSTEYWFCQGSANVGKSAFISALLKLMAEKDPVAASAQKYKPIQSAVPGTTLGSIQINAFLGGGKLYDTPGVHLHHRQAAVVHSEDLPSLAPQSRLRGQSLPNSQVSGSGTTRQGNSNDLNGYLIFWGGLVRVDVLKVLPETRLTFYGPKSLQIHMVPTDEADEFYQKHVGVLLTPPTGKERADEWRGLDFQRQLQIKVEDVQRPACDAAISGLGLTTTTSFPTNLISLTINKIKNCKALMESQGLQRLTSLRELRLRGEDDGGLVSFPPAAENSKETEILLPRSLVILSIRHFPNLKKLSKGFQFLTSLESIWIWNCPKLTTLPVEEGLPLSILFINNCPLLEQRYKGRYRHKIAHIPSVEINDELI